MIKIQIASRSLISHLKERELPGYVRWLVLGAVGIALLALHHTGEKLG